MTDHAYVQHPVWNRDQCEYLSPDPEVRGICGMPRSAHAVATCEVCGRPSVATYGLGVPGTPINKVCFRVKAGADTTCYQVGYERSQEALAAANARADAAEAELRFARLAEKERAKVQESFGEALAAARRECDLLAERVARLRRLHVNDYQPWHTAGGPCGECRHGRADGVPCRECDEEEEARTALAAPASASGEEGK